MREKIDTTKLRGHFRGIAESLGYEYVGAEFEGARSGTLVRIYIDTPDGVGHAECESVSRQVAAFLDEAEEAGAPFFQGGYFIEVSSPGLERPLFTLDHYRRFAGRRVALKTTAKKRITGDIVSCGEDDVVLALDDGTSLRLALGDIERANLVYKMEKGEKKSHKSGKKNGKKKSK